MLHVRHAAQDDGAALVHIRGLEVQHPVHNNIALQLPLLSATNLSFCFFSRSFQLLFSASVFTASGCVCLDVPLHGSVEEPRGGDAAGVLDDLGHGEALVEHAQLALGGLLVGGVEEAAAVEQRPVHVRHHRPHVARRVRRRLVVLERVHLGLGGRKEENGKQG